MITDKETNFIYFSSLIKEKQQYTPFWEKIQKVLTKKRIGYGFIRNTRDIWCRDYMPIQIDTDKFVQFNFFQTNCIAWNIKVIENNFIGGITQKTPDRLEQEIFVLSRLNSYLSTADYLLIAKGFELVWERSTGLIMGDENIKSKIYRYLEEQQASQNYPNHIPQHYVEQTVDLILAYMNSIKQWEFPIYKS